MPVHSVTENELNQFNDYLFTSPWYLRVPNGNRNVSLVFARFNPEYHRCYKTTQMRINYLENIIKNLECLKTEISLTARIIKVIKSCATVILLIAAVATIAALPILLAGTGAVAVCSTVLLACGGLLGIGLTIDVIIELLYYKHETAIRDQTQLFCNDLGDIIYFIEKLKIEKKIFELIQNDSNFKSTVIKNLFSPDNDIRELTRLQKPYYDYTNRILVTHSNYKFFEIFRRIAEDEIHKMEHGHRQQLTQQAVPNLPVDLTKLIASY